jgi:hypothetical protein
MNARKMPMMAAVAVLVLTSAGAALARGNGGGGGGGGGGGSEGGGAWLDMYVKQIVVVAVPSSKRVHHGNSCMGIQDGRYRGVAKGGCGNPAR